VIHGPSFRIPLCMECPVLKTGKTVMTYCLKVLCSDTHSRIPDDTSWTLNRSFEGKMGKPKEKV